MQCIELHKKFMAKCRVRTEPGGGGDCPLGVQSFTTYIHLLHVLSASLLKQLFVRPAVTEVSSYEIAFAYPRTATV